MCLSYENANITSTKVKNLIILVIEISTSSYLCCTLMRYLCVLLSVCACRHMCAFLGLCMRLFVGMWFCMGVSVYGFVWVCLCVRVFMCEDGCVCEGACVYADVRVA